MSARERGTPWFRVPGHRCAEGWHAYWNRWLDEQVARAEAEFAALRSQAAVTTQYDGFIFTWPPSLSPSLKEFLGLSP